MRKAIAKDGKESTSVTLRDVARVAGVSVSTASRALHGASGRAVTRAIEERVWEAARQVDYRPNEAAQQLGRNEDGAGRRTHNVGIIVTAAYRFSDPFWAPVLDGVTDELLRQQYHVRFTYLAGDLEDDRRRHFISPLFVDGLLLMGDMTLPGVIGDVGWPAPMVAVLGADCVRDWEADLRLDVVTIEKRVVVGQLVDHLVALGRRGLAFLGPTTAQDKRAEAFVQALARQNLPLPPEFLVECAYTTDDAYRAASSFFSRLDHAGLALDGLVCGCDTIAIGALRAARECGLRVPDDLALTGFDDITFARDTDPPLTTAHVPKTVLGEVAARRLLERIERPDWPPLILTVPTSLVVRASSGTLAAPSGADDDDGREPMSPHGALGGEVVERGG